MKHDLKLNVPITTYHDVRISPAHMIELLKQEQKKLYACWDGIYKKDGKRIFYMNGYGSHNIGEEDGPEVPEPILEIYDKLQAVIDYFKDKK